MAFDVSVCTQGDVRGIVLSVELGPDFLINAERFSVCARLQHVASELLKTALYFSPILTVTLAT